MATYDITQTTPTKLKTGDIINVPYSGTYKTITLPKGIYKLEVWGAQGGSFNTTYVGGKGGYSYGTLTLTDKETILYCYAGGKGTDGTTSGTFAGGWNGGGQAYTSSATYDMSAGGGGSDIRIGSTSLYARVIVAGGGGGAGSYSDSYRYSGGAGGGTSGATGGQYSTSYKAGLAGSQTGVGTSYYGTTANSTSYGTVASFGTGASGSSGQIAGGGGGWYGGGYARRASGGGGSGYVYTSSTASNYPSGCLLTSAYYLTDAATVSGNTSFVDYSGSTVTGHSGNGYVRITVVEIKKDLKVKTKVEYTELSYIESTGTQYIDTRFIPNHNTEIEVTFSTTQQKLGGIATACTNWTKNAFCIYVNAVSFGASYQATGGWFGDGVKHTLKLTKDAKLYCDGSVVWIGAVSQFTAPVAMLLLSEHSSETGITQSPNAKLYACKIWDNGILVRNFIPCKNANGIVGLYDLVNGVFYYNAGTGNFIAGEVIQKVTTSVWKDSQECYVKTDDNTWAEGKSVYVKTNEDLAILDYIESTGTQWIDTKYIPNSNTRIVMDFKSTQVPSGWYGFYSSRAGSSGSYGSQFALWMNSTGEFRSNYSTDTGIYLASTISPTDRHVIDHNKTVVAMDGTVVATHASATFTGACNLFLFAGHTGGVMELPANMILYSCQIYDNDVLIRDYIPVIDSSGVACLYDKVTNQLFYNAGTGNFIAGYKTEFEPETELVFLESTGTQYVDTGVTATQNTGYEIDFSTDSPLTTDSSWGAVMGAITSGTNRFGFDTYTSHAGGALYYGKPIYDPNIVVGKRMTISLMDGVLTTQSATTTLSTSTFDTGASIALFARKWNTGTIDGCSKTKIYACKIYDNGILVRDYIPKTDIIGTPALFDKVSQTYYYNAGTGTFKTGTILKYVYWKQVI